MPFRSPYTAGPCLFIGRRVVILLKKSFETRPKISNTHIQMGPRQEKPFAQHVTVAIEETPHIIAAREQPFAVKQLVKVIRLLKPCQQPRIQDARPPTPRVGRTAMPELAARIPTLPTPTMAKLRGRPRLIALQEAVPRHPKMALTLRLCP